MSEEHPVIYLQPDCKGCNADEGRLWCQDDVGPCEECGLPWVRYDLAALNTPGVNVAAPDLYAALIRITETDINATEMAAIARIALAAVRGGE